MVLGRQEALGQVLAVAHAALAVRLGIGLLQRLRPADGYRRQDDVAHQIQALRGILGVNRDIPGRAACQARVDLARHVGERLGVLHQHGESARQGQLLALGGGAGPAAEAGRNAARTGQRGLQVVQEAGGGGASHRHFGRRAISRVPLGVDAVKRRVQVHQPQLVRVDLVQRAGRRGHIAAIRGDGGQVADAGLRLDVVNPDDHRSRRAKVGTVRPRRAFRLIGGQVVFLVQEGLLVSDGLVIHPAHDRELGVVLRHRIDGDIAARRGDRGGVDAVTDAGGRRDIAHRHAQRRAHLELGGRFVDFLLDIGVVLGAVLEIFFLLDLRDLVAELAAAAIGYQRAEEALHVLRAGAQAA